MTMQLYWKTLRPAFLAISARQHSVQKSKLLPKASIWQHPLQTATDLISIFLMEMPELNGFEVARKLRVYQPDAGIIFLTSHFEFADEGYRVRALRYVQKLKYQQDLPRSPQ